MSKQVTHARAPRAIKKDLKGLPADVAINATYSAEDVIAITAKVGGIDISRLLDIETKPLSLIRFRGAAILLLRTKLGLSTPEIAHKLGYKEHSGIVHHLQRTCMKPQVQAVAQQVEQELLKLVSYRSKITQLEAVGF